MPISKHFSGHGKKVMADMKERYGDKEAERIFYATENKMKSKKKKKRHQSTADKLYGD
jgi:hypothetical protein